jgi:serine phosphatase RsbU (regulator of sigma subunit)
MTSPASSRLHRSIATRLRWSYLLTSTLPLVVVGALLLYLNLDSEQRRVYAEQRSAAQRVARDVGRYVENLRRDLDTFTLRVRPTVANDSLVEAAKNLQARAFPDLIELSVIERNLSERLRVMRLQSVASADLRSYTGDAVVERVLRSGDVEYSLISSDPSGSPVFTLVIPVRNDAGAVIGALRAVIAATPIADELRAARLDSTSSFYLLNQANNRYLDDAGRSGNTAPPQIARLLSSGSETGAYVGADSQEVVGAVIPVLIGERRERTNWMVVAERPAGTAFASVRRSAILLAALVGVVGMLALFWALRQARRFLAPIEALRQGAAALGSGRLDHRIAQIADDELGNVAHAFNQMAGHLQESLVEIAQQNDRLRRGLALARDIQVGLLPDRPPWSGDTVDVCARSIPAYEVGGDFYTYLALSEGRVAVAIGDISGKGIGAALLMALTASTVESQGRQLEHPAQVLQALNHVLAPRLKANHMNAALLFAVFDPQQATLRVANAGMIAPIVISYTGNHFIDVGGLPVGAYSGARYSEEELQLTAGDTLLLVSDGVVEAHSPDGELFGFERLESLIADVRPGDVRTLVERVLAAVQEHMNGAEQHDDITIVAIRPQIRTSTPQGDKEQAIDYAVI